MKKFYLNLFILFFTTSVFSQVTKVDVVMEYNKVEKVTDVYLIVIQGYTKDRKDRIQFNSQITIKVPKNKKFEIAKSYNPLQNNQDKDSDTPCIWNIEKPTKSPQADPKFDYYAVTPKTIPTSFYNDLMQGDKVKLFSIDNGGKKLKKMAFYQRGIDPDEMAAGMQGRDYTLSICIGGIEQDYVK